MTFYDCLIDLCKKKGTTPASVARDIGLSNSATTYWKRGSVPKYETLKKLADYFGISVDELTSEKEHAGAIVDHVKEGLRRSGPLRKRSDAEMHRAGVLQFNSDADRVAHFFRLLNDEGKEVAADRVEELSEIPKYQHQEAPKAPIEGKDTPPPETPSEGR